MFGLDLFDNEWGKQGKPQSLTPAQLAELHAASQTKDSWVKLAIEGEAASLTIELPAYGVAELTVAF